MIFYKTKWFQILGVFTLGILLGVWQYIPVGLPKSSSNPAEKVLIKLFENEFNQSAFKDTAEIEPLLNIQAPDINASVDEWYLFALSFDELDLGGRFGNQAQTTPMLAWYAYIAKHKPEAIYKLYNQNKLGKLKFEHLLRYGYLRYWDEYVNNVDAVLLKISQAVLTMAYNRGKDKTRKRVAQAFFTLAESNELNNELEIENLLFAIKGMSEEEKIRVLPILKSGIFQIDPRFIHRLKLVNIFDSKDIVLLMINILNVLCIQKRMMSSYMVDGALLGNKEYIKAMLPDLEDNAKQPTNFYCAACGIALSTDGLIGYPLINAQKKGKVVLTENTDGQLILSRKGEK